MLTRRSFLQTAPVLALAGAPAPVSAAAPKSLKISRIETWKVIVPMRPGTTVSLDFGPTLDIRLRDFDKVPKFIIRLTGENGVSGVGETGRGESASRLASNVKALQGKDALSVPLGEPSLGLPDATTADAFEMAIYDLLGKTLGVRVCDMLGGCRQEKVAVTYWTGQRTEADLMKVCEMAKAQGYAHLKFKARKGDPIVSLLATVHRNFPDLSLTVDFNQSYKDLAGFLPVARGLDQGYKLVIEDPIPPNLDWWSQLRHRTAIPFALTTGNPRQMMQAIKMNAVDVFNLGGDMRTFARLCTIAEAADIPVWHGSGVELGIRDMSFVHAAAATVSCTIPSDTLSFLRENDLIGGAFRPKDGYIDVPKKPGLGVELDEEALKRYRAS
jgi:muconate cycloisomerase